MNVGKATTVTGAMMNSATGALTLSTDSLVATDLKDVNQLNTTGGGFSAGFNTDAKTGKTSPTGSINVNLENKDKQGITKGTIGAGSVNVRSLSTTEQADLIAQINRDPKKFTQVIVDNWDVLRAEVDLTNLAAVAPLFQVLGQLVFQFENMLTTLFQDKPLSNEQKATLLTMMLDGVSKQDIQEQCIGGGYNRYNPFNWIITPVFAQTEGCVIRKNGKEYRISKEFAKDCLDAYDKAEKDTEFQNALEMTKKIRDGAKIIGKEPRGVECKKDGICPDPILDPMDGLINPGGASRGLGGARTNSFNGTYQPNPKHDRPGGGVSPQPTNPVETLANSFPIGGNSNQRIGYDVSTNQIVTFQMETQSVFHGYAVSSFWDLPQSHRNVLIQNGIFTHNGRVRK